MQKVSWSGFSNLVSLYGIVNETVRTLKTVIAEDVIAKVQEFVLLLFIFLITCAF